MTAVNCNGCGLGLPINNGVHYDLLGKYRHMRCRAEKYSRKWDHNFHHGKGKRKNKDSPPLPIHLQVTSKPRKGSLRRILDKMINPTPKPKAQAFACPFKVYT